MRESLPRRFSKTWVNDTPNEGLIVAWLPFYLGCEVIATRPDTLMDVLKTYNYDWEKPSVIKKVLDGFLGNGLTQVEGNEHKAMRRAVTPAFSGRQIRELVPLFCAKGNALVDVMARRVERG